MIVQSIFYTNFKNSLQNISKSYDDSTQVKVDTLVSNILLGVYQINISLLYWVIIVLFHLPISSYY